MSNHLMKCPSNYSNLNNTIKVHTKINNSISIDKSNIMLSERTITRCNNHKCKTNELIAFKK